MVKAIIENEHYLTRIFAGNNALVADEPLSNNGLEKGFAPEQLLAASLASCTCITLRMYSDRKNWNTGSIEVIVTIEKEPDTDTTRMERKITFGENLSTEQLNKLMEIADRCPIHKMLTKTILVNTII